MQRMLTCPWVWCRVHEDDGRCCQIFGRLLPLLGCTQSAAAPPRGRSKACKTVFRYVPVSFVGLDLTDQYSFHSSFLQPCMTTRTETTETLFERCEQIEGKFSCIRGSVEQQAPAGPSHPRTSRDYSRTTARFAECVRSATNLIGTTRSSVNLE